MYNKFCEYCGNHFIAKRSDKRFCNRICKALKGHYRNYKPRFYRQGKHPNTLKVVTGNNHYAYKDRIIKNGYIYIKRKNHPYAGRGGIIPEHRVIMEEHLGRYLLPTEVVHHIDFDRSNNQLENLHLFNNLNEHMKYHHFLREITISLVNYAQKF